MVSRLTSNIAGIRLAELSPSGVGIFSALFAANLICWTLASLVFRGSNLLIGTAVLAYTLGLRHAVDADHIAAIDNVTRNMMQAGKRPLAVGLFFSLGHSTVVFAASAAIAASFGVTQLHFEVLKEMGGVIGTGVSAAFLLAIGIINLVSLISIGGKIIRVRSGAVFSDDELSPIGSGFVGRIFGSRFKLITQSWQMYPLGFLFGLGFDTATEIALLGIAASQSSQGLPLWSILLFPALFTAGMTLIDTADGFLMMKTYGWALAEPSRRIYYNFIVTLVSVLVALIVGGIEALGLIGDKFSPDSNFWQAVTAFNDNLGTLGYAIVAMFFLIWISFLFVKKSRLD
jgi:high-affinity nickel-transport protein